jgi:hypothetical protein
MSETMLLNSKSALINMVQASQFCRKAHEYASAHLKHFLEICSTFTIKGFPETPYYSASSHSHFWGSEAMILRQQR